MILSNHRSSNKCNIVQKLLSTRFAEIISVSLTQLVSCLVDVSILCIISYLPPLTNFIPHLLVSLEHRYVIQPFLYSFPNGIHPPLPSVQPKHNTELVILIELKKSFSTFYWVLVRVSTGQPTYLLSVCICYG